jgi:hypothetical protein
MPIFGQSNYKWTSEFFREDLRRLPSEKREVVAKFARFSGLSGENLRRAFLPDLDPLVKVENLPGLYGYTRPSGSYEIQLATVFIEEFEAALPANGPPRSQVYYAPTELEEKALLLLEVTVLHELIHHFRLKNDGAARVRSMSNRGRGEEERWARQFEKEAYGMVYTVQNLSVAASFPRTAATTSK